MPTIPAPRTPSSHRHSPGEIPATRSHSTCEKAGCHGINWFEYHYGVKQNINGPHLFFQWFLRNNIGSNIIPGSEEGETISCMDLSPLLFPPNQLRWMTLYTSQYLVKRGEKGTTKGGMIKCFGNIILATRLDFRKRSSLWSTVSQSKYRSSPDFGKTSMNRHSLDIQWSHVRWSHHTYVQGEDTIHESHWWKLGEDCVAHFNESRTHLFCASDLICADESIPRWYVQGGHWINLGFPIYMTMDRKP